MVRVLGGGDRCTLHAVCSCCTVSPHVEHMYICLASEAYVGNGPCRPKKIVITACNRAA
jgi:hypothetical protein